MENDKYIDEKDIDRLIFRVLAAREGGNVRRCHTMAYLGDYTNGKHTYDAVALLMILYPECSKPLIQAVMFHDCGERWCGDLPAPAKWFNPELSDVYQRAEDRALAVAGLSLPPLSPYEEKWLHAVDRLELLLWCWDQYFLGNQNVRNFMHNLEQWMERSRNDLPRPAVEFWDAVNNRFRVLKTNRLPEHPNELEKLHERHD